MPTPDLTQAPRTKLSPVKSAEQYDSTEQQAPPKRTLAASCCTAHLSWSKKSSTDGSVSPVSVPSPSTCSRKQLFAACLNALLLESKPRSQC